MKIAINKKYKYLTFEEHCQKGEVFEDWVMQEKFETHSILHIEDDVDKENLMYNQFDYDENTDTFTFNINKYNEHIEKLNEPQLSEPTQAERLEALEMLMVDILGGGF